MMSKKTHISTLKAALMLAALLLGTTSASAMRTADVASSDALIYAEPFEGEYLEYLNDSSNVLSKSVISLANSIASMSDSLNASTSNAHAHSTFNNARVEDNYVHAAYDLSLDIPSDTIIDVDMQRDYPGCIRVVGEDNIASDTLLQQFCLYSADINFAVNKTNIDPTQEAYRRLIEEAVPILKSRQLDLHHMYVRMSASPEGGYANNVRLAKGRGKALVDSLARYINMPAENQIVLNTVPEDYACLYKMIERSDDPDRDAIMEIITTHRGDDAATKAALRALNGGTTWKRLLKEYYPQLRSARVVFYFTRSKMAIPEPQGVEAAKATLQHELLPLKAPVFNAPVVEKTTETKPEPEPEPEVVDTTSTREPMLNVKTNLLYDAFFIPGQAYDPIVNVELEYYPKNSNWGFVAEYDFPWWSNDEGMLPTSKHHYFQMLNWSVEARRYFTFNGWKPSFKADKTHTGHYLDAYAHAGYYDFCLNTNGRGVQGEGFGAGLGYGYVQRLGDSRWKLEFSVKVGYMETRYDPYYYGAKTDANHNFISARYYYDYEGEASSFIRRNWRYRYFGPTGVGITLSYDLFDRHNRNK